MLGVVNGFDDEPIVSRKVEKRSRFAWRTEFRENVFGSQGKQVVRRVQVKVVLTQFSEDPWSVIFEFEIVSS